MARRLVVEADGGSRGNPGNAGYGALVRDAATGAVLAERAESVGIASNNVAEYSGLVAGLQAVLDIEPGAADVEVRMDSKLVIEQMAGRWKIKHEDMRRLALEARDVAARISDAGGSVRFTWVPRAENSAADKLANAAMDGESISRQVGATSTEPVAAASGESTTTAPDLGVPTRLVLVRHGVTDFTVAGKLDGRGGTDPALNAAGQAQAQAAGRAVANLVGHSHARLVTSSLTRARQTGEAIARTLGIEAEVDADWDEQSFGDWDGRSMGQISARWPEELGRLRGDLAYARPGGESHSALAERVLAAYRRAVEPGGVVVVATHRKPILVVLTELLGIPHERIWRLLTAPGSLSAVEVWADGGASVAFVNHTAHLRQG
ncbi:bifunctional RNase H/acid phosphatase [Oryzihumus sp.]|uniref:bifunctional RNase H/acid phosphatase n=1 Tax=Oryzihumus sp. TaxID=1968903 RepID=UPI002ED8D3C6